MSAFYAIYHGPEGLKRIAHKLWASARLLQNVLMLSGYKTVTKGLRQDGAVMFDTLVVESDEAILSEVHRIARSHGILLRPLSSTKVGISMNESMSLIRFNTLMMAFKVPAELRRNAMDAEHALSESIRYADSTLPDAVRRVSPFLTHPVFNSHHSETELLRYIHHLQSKDLSLVHSMIPLGSCTMKLNATTEMLPLSSREFANLHPFAPQRQRKATESLLIFSQRIWPRLQAWTR